jgi:predicted metal-dependent phosphoesterase TrpH
MTPISTIDLHLHTHYSDGRFSPEEVLRHAVNVGLKTIAITDHDNTNGSRHIADLARQLGVELIPAVEFTSRLPGCDTSPEKGDIDVLGYFLTLDNPEFRAFEQAALNDIHLRVGECCDCLTGMGYPITLEEVFAENPRYAGVLPLVHAIQKKGYAQDWDSAQRLVDSGWLPGRLSPFTAAQVIEQIHLAGGVAVLAHPAAIHCNGEWLQVRQLGGLVQAGLDGLEIYHPRLDQKARTYFLKLAHQFNLLVSGGSDSHGWGVGLHRIGSQPVSPEMVEALRSRHEVLQSIIRSE